MCGITGYSTLKGVKLSNTKRQIRANIAKGLLIVNESRGIDSTGVFLQNGGFHILSKDTCHATKFVREKKVIKAFKKDSYLMLGHTRQATSGIVNKLNAHPFIKGNIVGVHNGIISNDEELAKENKFNIQVDSEIIFELLNKNDNDFKKTFKKISGSASIAWIDKREPSTLYLVAHDNPISIAQVPILNTIFFSSEFVALDSILQASVGTENYSVWELEENIVYKITSDHKIEKFKVSFKEWGYFYKNWTRSDEDDKKESSIYDEDDPLFQNLKDKDLKDTKLDPEELNYLKNLGKKSGCAICHKPLTTYAYVDNFQNDLIYCVDCIADEEVENHMWINLVTGVYSVI